MKTPALWSLSLVLMVTASVGCDEEEDTPQSFEGDEPQSVGIRTVEPERLRGCLR